MLVSLQKKYNMACQHFPDFIEFVKFSATVWAYFFFLVLQAYGNNKRFILAYRSWAGFHENTDSICILAS